MLDFLTEKSRSGVPSCAPARGHEGGLRGFLERGVLFPKYPASAFPFRNYEAEQDGIFPARSGAQTGEKQTLFYITAQLHEVGAGTSSRGLPASHGGGGKNRKQVGDESHPCQKTLS